MTGKAIYLKAMEARLRDVGRGICRMDPADMEQLGVCVGEVVEIQAERAAVARAMPTFSEDRGRHSIQVDGIIRRNARAGIGSMLRVSRTECRLADSVTLTPMGFSLDVKSEEVSALVRLMEGMPLRKGDQVRLTLFGGHHNDFLVEDLAPGDTVLVCPRTRLRITGRALGNGEARISYEDIGGLGKAVRRIREMIELPLKHPEVFRRLGIDPPKGVLLHGPPGCGKTLIARAVAGETSAHFLHVNGPEIMHKFYGESEAHLREIFEEARRHSPSIVFIDEIDAIAPKRQEVTGEVEKRVVAQLLALMDGLRARGEVIVIGATNIPGAMDQAIRRPGRFDREISIPVPDRRGRLEILQIHTRGMPLGADVNLDDLARVTHGFVGADLEALCREAAMAVLGRILPALDLGVDSLPLDALASAEVTMEDFLTALAGIEPSAIREVFVDVGSVRWDDIGGLAEAKQALIEAVVWPLSHREAFQVLRLRPPRGVLLEGPPGTGKTLLAKAVATESGLNLISVKGPALFSRFVGESEKAVREVFQKARQASPCILFFDEIDALLQKRQAGANDSHVSERVIGQFLAEMDGIEGLRDVVVLGATNRPDLLDPALLRPGRFDVRIAVNLPDRGAREEILRVHLRGVPTRDDVDVRALADKTEGLTGAELEALCLKARLCVIREALASSQAAESGLVLGARHFHKAFEPYIL